MHLVGTEQPSMHLRCAIASELLDELSAVPLEFFHSLSTGSLHHLAQVGQMLGDATQPPLSAWRYLQVRNILIILADFLEKIESTRISPPGLAVELRSKISQMDRSMQQSSKWNQVPGLLSMGRSLLLGLSDQAGVENRNPLNGQQDDFASQFANGIRPMSQSFSPSMAHFSRLLGLNDPMPDQFSTQELQSSTMSVDAITAAEEQRAATALDMAQQGPHQTQESDLGFTLAQSNPIPTDIFDGWQTLLR
ncbi:hypothetical protein N7528_004896 [Penicillium herquei]|nr:hypothetical protein N7528_004896 [Penicillium herquei]